MKKLVLVVVLLLACALFAGCSNQNMDIPVMEEPNETVLNETVLTETVLTETITWENVLIEGWD